MISKPNNFHTNARNVVKIFFDSICEVNLTISLKILGVYSQKIKIRMRPLCRQTPKENFKASI